MYMLTVKEQQIQTYQHHYNTKAYTLLNNIKLRNYKPI